MTLSRTLPRHTKTQIRLKIGIIKIANRLRNVESIVTEGNIVDWLTKKIVPKEVEVPFMDLIGESK